MQGYYYIINKGISDHDGIIGTRFIVPSKITKTDKWLSKYWIRKKHLSHPPSTQAPDN